MRFSVEELLRMSRDRAALLRAYADHAARTADDPPDARTLSGLADICGEIETWVGAIHEAIGVEALGIEVRLKR